MKSYCRLTTMGVIYIMLLTFVDRDCTSQPCQNGGVCRNSGQGNQCVCPPGWTGHMCEHGQYLFLTKL